MWYKLKNITKKENESGFVEFLKNQYGSDTEVNIYELNKTTRIIYTNHEIHKHISISNHKREVREIEIHFVVEQIMKLKDESIQMWKSDKGIVHLHYTQKVENLPLH